jgi:hypothetical protein
MAKDEKKVKTPKVTATPVETALPEPKPKRNLTKWQCFVRDFSKENPKCGRNLFRLAYEKYPDKKASPKA